MVRDRKKRRGLLLCLTLLVVGFVVSGSLFMGLYFESRPTHFAVFVSVCFVGVFLLLALAMVDMRMVRQEYRARQVELDVELAEIASDAESMAQESLKNNELE